MLTDCLKNADRSHAMYYFLSLMAKGPAQLIYHLDGSLTAIDYPVGNYLYGATSHYINYPQQVGLRCSDKDFLKKRYSEARVLAVPFDDHGILRSLHCILTVEDYPKNLVSPLKI